MKTLSDPDLEMLARRAQDGDRHALEELALAVKDGLYNLALRMLWHPQYAEDATQEILVKLLTRLGASAARPPSRPGRSGSPRTT